MLSKAYLELDLEETPFSSKNNFTPMNSNLPPVFLKKFPNSFQ
jgi:hypothetical protein